MCSTDRLYCLSISSSSLVLVQLVVDAFLSHQLKMTAFLNNLSFAKNSNAVSVVNTGKAMCYDDGGASTPCFLQRFLDNFFTFWIQSWSSFVQQQNFGVLDQCPCNCNPLLLPTTQGCRILTNISIVALGNEYTVSFMFDLCTKSRRYFVEHLAMLQNI